MSHRTPSQNNEAAKIPARYDYGAVSQTEFYLSYGQPTVR